MAGATGTNAMSKQSAGAAGGDEGGYTMGKQSAGGATGSRKGSVSAVGGGARIAPFAGKP